MYHLRDWHSLLFLKTLLVSRTEGLQFTISISVSMKADDLDISEELGGFGDDGLDLGLGGECNGFRQRRDQLRALNSLLWLVIYQIPKERLQYFRYVSFRICYQIFGGTDHGSFRWHHSTTCSKLSNNLVATRHGKSLRNLQLNNTCEGWAEGIHTCHALSTLHIADLDPQITSSHRNGLHQPRRTRAAPFVRPQ